MPAPLPKTHVLSTRLEGGQKSGYSGCGQVCSHILASYRYDGGKKITNSNMAILCRRVWRAAGGGRGWGGETGNFFSGLLSKGI